MRFALATLAALALGCGGRPREDAMCEHVDTLCGVTAKSSGCVDEMRAMREPLGDKFETLMACGLAAASCAEFTLCYHGTVDAAVEALNKDLSHDLSDRDPKKAAWRHLRSPMASGSVATSCAQFHGETRAATWDACSDRVKRALSCTASVGGFDCACVEDGVEKWRFTTRDPHLETATLASGLAKSNCHQSFVGF